MHPSVLITDGGTHTPAQWANLSAQRLLPIDDPRIPESERISAERRPAAMRLQAAVAEALLRHFEEIRTGEIEKLSSCGLDHLETEHTGHHSCLEEALADIRLAAEGTPWQAHFWDPSVEETVRGELGSHMTEIQKIERLWHCDQQAPTPQIDAYRARVYEHGV